ncbi:MAG: hypothetical protein DSY47_07240, partial [Hydrogenothermus sp.]
PPKLSPSFFASSINFLNLSSSSGIGILTSEFSAISALFSKGMSCILSLINKLSRRKLWESLDF